MSALTDPNPNEWRKRDGLFRVDPVVVEMIRADERKRVADRIEADLDILAGFSPTSTAALKTIAYVIRNCAPAPVGDSQEAAR